MAILSKLLLAAMLIVGVLITYITVKNGVKTSFVLFPIFAGLIQSFHYRETKRFNSILLIFLVSSMCSEVLYLYDYKSNINLTAFFSVISSAAVISLLRPVLSFNFKQFAFYNITEIVIGFIGAAYVLGFVLLAVMPQISDWTLFIPALIAFTFSSLACLSIPAFNRHTDNLIILIAGVAYLLEMCTAFAYLFIYKYEMMLVLAIAMGVLFKVFLGLYLTKMRHIYEPGEDYI